MTPEVGLFMTEIFLVVKGFCGNEDSFRLWGYFFFCQTVGLLLISSNPHSGKQFLFSVFLNCASLQFNKDIYSQLSKSSKQLLTPCCNESVLSNAGLIACEVSC